MIDGFLEGICWVVNMLSISMCSSPWGLFLEPLLHFSLLEAGAVLSESGFGRIHGPHIPISPASSLPKSGSSASLPLECVHFRPPNRVKRTRPARNAGSDGVHWNPATRTESQISCWFGECSPRVVNLFGGKLGAIHRCDAKKETPVAGRPRQALVTRPCALIHHLMRVFSKE